MLSLVSATFAFNAPVLPTGSAVRMAEPVMMDRRQLVGTFAAAAAAMPMAAFADGATSPATLERARAIYGSRIARLSKAPAEEILAEKNAFTLFTTGAYRSVKDKETTAKLNALSKTAIASAKSGDTAGAQSAVKEFISVGNIRELDTVEGGNYNPKQRRNPGAPPTSEIEAQMGSLSYALYEPVKKK